LISHPILETNIIIRKIYAMIEDIRQKAATGQYEYSRHAVDQTIKRRIEPDKDLWIDHKIGGSNHGKRNEIYVPCS
jgi:hypothetical protein